MPMTLKRLCDLTRSWGVLELRKPVCAWVAQLVERVLGKDEVTGSIPVPGSSYLGFHRGTSSWE
jgi:hypothetical protein